ncbi:MAG: type II toxin-antitoxin system RelB/DinJ family antitoxin [Ruminococcaceae bacterium]|nr:type II toxin-antitoxin system RelB/DinJ family antitoxin [Oscillospiraceae bacterium]MBQ6874600.1 type II toxin-antitoxin system RelB/DinJ family antitoxin [Clostridia bacterium]
MATKTANVLARVEPDVKQQAEEIMSQLGIPVSVVINMLYKQIIMKKGIPFSLSLPSAPTALDEMNKTSFNSIMETGLKQAENGESLNAEDVFNSIRREIANG